MWPGHMADRHLDSAQVHGIIAASMRDVEAAREALHLITMPP